MQGFQQVEAILIGQIEVDHQRLEGLAGIGLASPLGTALGDHLEAHLGQVLAIMLALHLDILDQQQTACGGVGQDDVLEHLLEVLAGDRLDQVARAIAVPVLRLRHAGDDMYRHIAMLQQATQAPVDLPAADIRQENVEDHRDETLALQQGDGLLAGAAVHAGETMGLGLLGDHRGKVGVVLDDQHGRATARTQRRGIGRIVLAPGRLQGQHRQTHDEARALPRSTLQADLPAQYLDQLASDGQPQPGTAKAPAGGAVDLLEGLEDALMLRWVDADAAVANDELQGLALLVQRHRRVADGQLHLAMLGELEGVGQQVAQDLLQAPTVTVDHLRHARLQMGQQAQALDLGHRAQAGVQLHQQVMDIQRLQLELHAPGLDLGQVEHVVDQLQQVVAGLVDDVRMLDLLLAEVAGDVVAQLLAEDQDAVERRAQLVRHVGEELRFVAVGQRQLFGLFAQTLLGGLALADIDDHRLYQAIFTTAQRRQTNLQRNQPAIAVLAEQLAVTAHAPRRGVAEKTIAQRRMHGPGRLGQEYLHRFAEQLVAVVAEHLLDLAIDHTQPALAVDQHDRVGRGFHHQPEALLGSLALADIDDHRLHQHFTAGADRRQPDFERNQAAVTVLAEQLAIAAHAPLLRRLMKGLALGHMAVAQALR